MARFKKVVSAPGTYQTPDGPATVTPARIRHWADTINALVAAGIKPPVSWGHAKDALPHTPEDSDFWHARYVAGSVLGASVDAAGQLVVEGDTPGLEMDAAGRLVTTGPLADGRSVPTVAEEVSVGARDWTDGNGRLWKDAPVHLALTPLPVWVPEGGQPPFEPSPNKETQRFSLSSLLSRFSTEAPMAEEKKDDGPPKKGEGEEGGSGSSGAMLKKVLEKLTQVGVTLPDDTTPENLLERLYVAATAVAGGEGGAEPPAEQKEEAPLMMSTLAGIKDPTMRALATESAELKRDKRLERIAALKARGLPAHEAKRLTEQASAVWFSLGAGGKSAPHPVDPVLDSLERALPPAEFSALTTRLSDSREETPPEGAEGDRRKKSRELADRMARGVGLPPRPADANGRGA